MNYAEKLEQITVMARELHFAIAALSAAAELGSPSINDAGPAIDQRTRDALLVSYDFSEKPSYKVTCAEICKVLDVDPTRKNCSTVGRELLRLTGRRSTRSNGKTYHLMPPENETF